LTDGGESGLIRAKASKFLLEIAMNATQRILNGEPVREVLTTEGQKKVSDREIEKVLATSELLENFVSGSGRKEEFDSVTDIRFTLKIPEDDFGKGTRDDEIRDFVRGELPTFEPSAPGRPFRKLQSMAVTKSSSSGWLVTVLLTSGLDI